MSIIKPHLLAMSAYLPPLEGRDPKQHTLLDFNERTIPVSSAIVNALQQYVADGRLQQYPVYGDIVERLANYADVTPEQLMITNGSDQGIDLVFRAVTKSNTAIGYAEAIIPGPSFAMYQQCAKVEEMTLIEPQYTLENGYPTDEVLAAITEKTAIIVISNPNNPCGTVLGNEAVKRIAQAAPHAAILVDECYYEYSGVTAVSLLAEFPNLFITRTFSKTWGIPSLRFGYLMATPTFIKALCNVRGPYDINQLAIVAANAALDHPEFTEVYVDEVMNKAKPLLEQWLTENHIAYWPSSANYLWIFPDNPESLNQLLIDNDILVRPKKYQDKLGLRVTVGTLEQTEKLINILAEKMAE